MVVIFSFTYLVLAPSRVTEMFWLEVKRKALVTRLMKTLVVKCTWYTLVVSICATRFR